MTKRTIGAGLKILCLGILIIPAVVFAQGGSGFSDVEENDWFYTAVMTMAEQGIISGNPDGTFRPEDTVTCGEFITMALKAAEVELSPQQSPGKKAEGSQGHWARLYYDVALEKGYLKEREISENALDTPISRGRMAYICSNMMGSRISVEGDFYNCLQESVSDVEAFTPYEYEIIRSYGAGILSGYPDGTFRPEAYLSRGEAASVIWRLRDDNQRKVPQLEGNEEEDREEGGERSAGDGELGSRSQDERIASILEGHTAPIDFDPVLDTTTNSHGRVVMREEKAREYMDRILAGLKFHGKDGKYYMTVDLPQVPEGYQIHFAADIYYKQELMKGPWCADTNHQTYADAKLPSVGPCTVEIQGMDSVDQVYTVGAGISINRKDDTFNGSQEASYQLQRSYREGIRDHLAINRQDSAHRSDVALEYEAGRHFTWQ